MSESANFIPRDLLAKYFQKDPRLIAHFEDQATATTKNSEDLLAATDSLSEASVVTLSANASFNNEFILTNGDGTLLIPQPGTVTINVDKSVARVTQYSARFSAPADVTLMLPVEGTLISDVSPAILYAKTLNKPAMTGLVNASTESAAAAAGVLVGGIYRDGTTLKIRVT